MPPQRANGTNPDLSAPTITQNNGLPLQRVPANIRDVAPQVANPDNPDPPADEVWDYWPDGDFERFFTWDQADQTDGLMEHWACEPKGGDKRGSVHATEWTKGKRTRRECMGIIYCDDPSCNIIIRPTTRRLTIQQQLRQQCECGAKLSLQTCGATSTLYSFEKGIQFVHKGTHDHHPPTHILHLTPNQRARFEKIVYENPTAGPLSLLVGPQGRHGPKKGVGEISTILLNTDRIKAELRRLKEKGSTQEWQDTFAQFKADHDDWVVYDQFGPVSVIVMQTPFMASSVVKDYISSDAVNGIVSDAAHGYWKDTKNLLIISSTYNPQLQCWVPGIMTYTNGASEEHYRIHFLCLFERMAAECERRNIEITDDLFANVVDFSEAERAGYIEAFVDFWTKQGDLRSDDRLRQAAASLIKGCQQHFRSQVTRVSKISGAVPPHLKEHFQDRTMSLLEAPNVTEFNHTVDALLQDFPQIETWLRWWLRESHASMLFPPFRAMREDIWQSIPNTTNAEESMHWKIYRAVGSGYTLMAGMLYLLVFASHYDELAAAKSGEYQYIRYGQAERWKLVKADIGRTKPQRAPEVQAKRAKMNDGRPPDTSRQLLGKTLPAEHADDITRANLKSRPGYPWKDNSCWLDTRFRDISAAHPLSSLHQAMDFRMTMGSTHPLASKLLMTQRDGFRETLHSARIINSVKDKDTLIGWLGNLLKHKAGDESQAAELASAAARSYFEGHTVTLRSCTGTLTNAPHWQITRYPTQSCHTGFHLNARLSERYSGSIKKWFQSDVVQINRTPIDAPQCWQTADGAPLCSGASYFLSLFIHLPVMLILDLGDVVDPQNQWEIPRRLYPLSQGAAKSHGVVYEIVGLALFSPERAHFTARYTPNGRQIFDYDGLRNGGMAQLLKGANVSSHMTGFSDNMHLPDDYHIYGIIYQLEGGIKAQNFIARHQTQQAERLFGIHFDFGEHTTQLDGNLPHVSLIKPHSRPLAPEDLKWLKRPTKAKTIDYAPVPDPATDSTIISVPTLAENNALKDEAANILSSSQQSAYPVYCRCGLTGDGHGLSLDSAMVMCEDCQNWSHIACQRGARASNLARTQKFICDFCSPYRPSSKKNSTRRRRTEAKESEKPPKASLRERLAGKGALARIDKYWYPVRLIQRQLNPALWQVKFWRGCRFPKGVTVQPNQTVNESSLVDELWHDKKSRREIRLGKWIHACQTPDQEDLIAHFLQVPYPDEIHQILTRHISTLCKLLECPDPDGYSDLPVGQYLISHNQSPLTTGGYSIKFCGDFTARAYAEVANWFHHNVPGAKSGSHRWLGCAPLAHALTLLIAHRQRQIFEALPEFPTDGSEEEQMAFLLKHAWDDLDTKTGTQALFVDVDLECLAALEARMFEDSIHAGSAGNQQWGLDVGEHQHRWNPYEGLPEEWNAHDREFSETELQVSNWPSSCIF
ncbi:hypothetical protein BJ138DRAFT_1014934 [Hygrophoropsis aurantiaca]|uniref:Uncharacterized protein n=1 Tax=Hygrophoropsis aurantiaca TaxID=72124 RepID=A0ACB8A2A0_9AGAM|nr:hypothetical protein BJ138DRAFT_1014934 [Hygrophoropsis aurantiaca]